jgi:hypothetical protein
MSEREKMTSCFLQKAENGGWIVYKTPSRDGFDRTPVGAYTKKTDMLSDLLTLLKSDNQSAPEKDNQDE